MYDVIVIGGGPSGSTCATLLAQNGQKVALVEKTKFPRYSIGESLIPQVLDILEETGALSLVEDAGFLRKEGGTFRWGSQQEPWSFYFDEVPERSERDYAYQVSRLQFDDILLKYASSVGVRVYEETRAIGFSQGSLRIQRGIEEEDLETKLIVDCSGRQGFLAKLLGLRIYDSGGKIAVFSYFRGASKLPGRDANGIFCEAIKGGWLWNIPLSSGLNSVGFVTDEIKCSSQQELDQAIARSGHIGRILSEADQVENIRVISNYSYSSTHYSGEGFLIAGDAGGFIDPVWSTGVYLAMETARLAAKSILFEESNYDGKVKQLLGSYREFVDFFYGSEVTQKDVYWKAHQLVPTALSDHDAFMKIVSGRVGIQ